MIRSCTRLVFAGLFSLFLTLAAYAGPGLQYWQGLKAKEEVAALTKGSTVAHVHPETKTVVMMTLESEEAEAKLKTDGVEFVCPACQRKVRTVFKQRRDDPVSRQEVYYVDEGGDEVVLVVAPSK